MKPGRPRIWALAGVFAGVACVLVVHLYLLMVEQGASWVERSYRNRSGFKDVPTRRGSILDREGRMLAEDEPAFALFLHYRAFRRDHPIGCVVHGANLAMKAGGYGDDLFGFDRRQLRPPQALESLLSMPSSWLSGVGVPSDLARDLRFYVLSLAVHTTGRDWADVKRAVFGARPRSEASLADLLGAKTVEQVRVEFERRLVEFESLVTAMAVIGEEQSLWNVLEKQRGRRWTNPEAEHIERRVYRRLPFELAARVRLLSDRHPGWVARPAVARTNGVVPGRSDLASLRPLIGRATQYWKEDFDDEERPSTVLEEMLPEALLRDFVPNDPDLPAELAERVQARARLSIKAALQSQGRLGRWGLEFALDRELAGRPGLRLIEKDRTAREQGQWSSLETEPGVDCRLTVDLRLQACLERSLDGYPYDGEAAMAVIDPENGDVLALGGRPLAPLDSEKQVYTTPAATWRDVGFVGSVAKPFVALEQLDAERQGRVTERYREFSDCARRFPIPGSRRGLACAGHGAGIARSVEASLAHSCNFFYYQAAQSLGSAGVLRAFARAGWVAGESGDDPRYQKAVNGIARNRGAQGRSSVSPGGILEQKAIGYKVQASALQVARAYAGLATGKLPTVSLVDPDRPHDAVVLDVRLADLEQVRDGLWGCVTKGTAKGVEALRTHGVLAKTGTAEISTRGENNSWLAGYLTRRDPTMAFAAVAYGVPDGVHGGEVAGALVSDFLEEVYADPQLRRLYMPPVGTPR